jgi:hypothetical protein
MPRAIVEFGRPLSALPDTEHCGLSGKFVCDSAKKAHELAQQLTHVFMGRAARGKTTNFTVSREQPRVTLWSSDQTVWITVSILDIPGFFPGDYAANADKESKK